MAASIFQGNYIKLLKNALRLGSLSADPSGPEAGDVYYNSADTNLKYYNGTSFVGVGNGSIVTAWQTGLTPTLNGLGTVTSPTYEWRRVGDSLEMRGTFTTGTVSGAIVASISMPSGIVIDSSKLSSSSAGTKVGESFSPTAATIYIYPGAGGSSEPSQVLFYDGSDTAKIYFSFRMSSSTFNKDNASGIFSSSRPVTFNFSVPVVGWSAINTVSSAVQAMNVVTKTTTYTATTADDLILCSGSAFTVTLPSAVTQPGKILTIEKTDSSLANIITIATVSSQTIGASGGTSTTLNTINENLQIVSDGTNWQILGRRIPQDIGVAITMTPNAAGFGTIASATYKGYRVGKYLYVDGNFTTGTVGASGSNMVFQSGIAIDSSALSSSSAGTKLGDSYSSFGTTQFIYPGSTGASGASQVVFYDGSTTDRLFWAYRLSGGSFNKENVSAIFGSTQVVQFNFRIPVSGWNG